MKKQELIKFIDLNADRDPSVVLKEVREQLLKLEADTMEDEIAQRNLKEDLLLLADAAMSGIRYSSGCEFGSIGTDCKRPFGNSDVYGDMLRILGIADGWYELPENDQDVAQEYLDKLFFKELPKFIRVKWQEMREMEEA